MSLFAEQAQHCWASALSLAILQMVRHNVAVETGLAGVFPRISGTVREMMLDALDDLAMVPGMFALSSTHCYLDAATPPAEQEHSRSN